MHAAQLLAEESAEAVNHLAMPPEAFGLVTFGAMIVLLVTAYAFRSVGTRH